MIKDRLQNYENNVKYLPKVSRLTLNRFAKGNILCAFELLYIT